ncbi:MAG: hypothetical protein IPJ79_12540 [Bacteroidetes bacterium]|nr:hypothetical protein [Bacteroidota bacterium]HNR19562.1 hypothetical protein [Bacteroidia bacterium]HNU32799.1 hypothetical protein [Bacteroidia bacterium]
MNIEKELSKIISKSNAIKVASLIGCDDALFKQLIKVLLESNNTSAPQAAWTLSFCVQQCPEIIYPQLEVLIDNLYKKNLHDAVKRNTVRVMQYVTVPEKLQGKAADICFKYLSSGTEAIAIRAFSITVLCNICQQQPELSHELKLLLEEQMRNGEPAIISRGKKALKFLNTL